MRFGVIANLKREGATAALESFLDWSRRKGHDCLFSEQLRDVIPDGLPTAPRHAIASEVDIIISMGGDGTMLAAARAVGRVGTPLLGINLGSLGFLTQLKPRDLLHALDSIVAGQYQIEERMLLRADVQGKPGLESPFALNDVVVDNGPVSRLIDINLKVNGEDIVTYRADGLIISTPTGSTAYALAAGGPIVHPKMRATLVVPISSFSLSTRPMILDPTDVLELRIRSEHGVAGLTLDGQVTAPLIDTDRVIVTQAGFPAKFIVFPENSFYRLVKSKLHWGVSPSGGE
jgi:NAD+ kinase